MQEAAGNKVQGLTPGGASRQGRRPYQEDAYSYSAPPELSEPYGQIFIVADGVGGQQAGSLAAQITTTATQESYYALRRAGVEVLPALKQAIEQANAAVYSEAQKQGIARMGATVVAAVIDRGRLYVANVGDARAYLVTGGRLQRLTQDHSWVEEQVRAGNLTEEDARHHELRNIVTRVMGNAATVEVQTYKERPFRDTDILLLCSDGLYDVLEPGRMLALLARSSAPVAAEDLVREAYDAGSQDNITAVVVGGQPKPDPALAAAAVKSGTGPAASNRQTKLYALVGLALLALALLYLAARPSRGGGSASEALPNMGTQTPGIDATTTSGALKTLTPTPEMTSMPTIAGQIIQPETDLDSESVIAVDPSETKNLICLLSDSLFFWPDEKLKWDGDLCQPTDGDLVRTNQRAVYLLDEGEAREIKVDLGFGNCGPRQMLHIKVAGEDSKTGWIFAGTEKKIIKYLSECE